MKWALIILIVTSQLLFPSTGEAARTGGQTARARTSRQPASAQKSCPEVGCACEELQRLVQICENQSANKSDIKNVVHSELAVALRAHQDERRRFDYKLCPAAASGEVWRVKLGKIIANRKPKDSEFKVSASQDLGKFGVELIDSINRNPRSPANSK